MPRRPWFVCPYINSRPGPMFPVPVALPHVLGFIPEYIKKENTVKIDKQTK